MPPLDLRVTIEAIVDTSAGRSLVKARRCPQQLSEEKIECVEEGCNTETQPDPPLQKSSGQAMSTLLFAVDKVEQEFKEFYS